jgi:predicted nucleotidyltransferase
VTERPFKPRELLQALADRGVKFVVIGGLAVAAHGHPRATRDLDIVPDPSADNMRRLASAIGELHGELAGVDADKLGIALNAETLAQGANFPLETDLGRLDVLQQIGDEELHGLVAEDAVEVQIDGVPVRVCSIDSLRRLKRNAGRAQDIADLEALDQIYE